MGLEGGPGDSELINILFVFLQMMRCTFQWRGMKFQETKIVFLIWFLPTVFMG